MRFRSPACRGPFFGQARRRERSVVIPHKRPTTQHGRKMAPALRVAPVKPPLSVARRSRGMTTLRFSLLDWRLYRLQQVGERNLNRPLPTGFATRSTASDHRAMTIVPAISAAARGVAGAAEVIRPAAMVVAAGAVTDLSAPTCSWGQRAGISPTRARSPGWRCARRHRDVQ